MACSPAPDSGSEPLYDVVTWKRLPCDVEDGTFEEQYRKSFKSKGLPWTALPPKHGGASGGALVTGKEEVRAMLQRAHAALTLQKQMLRAQKRAGSPHLVQEAADQLQRTGLGELVRGLEMRDCQKRIYQCLLQISRIKDYLLRIRGDGDDQDPFTRQRARDPGSPADPFCAVTDYEGYSPIEPVALVHALHFLTAPEVCNAGCVNRMWRLAADDSELWERLCVARWGDDNVPAGAVAKEQGWRFCYYVGNCRKLLVHAPSLPTLSLQVYPELRFSNLFQLLGIDPRQYVLQSRHFCEGLECQFMDWPDAAQEEAPCVRIAALRPSGSFYQPCSACEFVPREGCPPLPPPPDPAAWVAEMGRKWKDQARRHRPLVPELIAGHTDAP
eukprot:TRINITY_DN25343_c0_g1_i1.p1 TRINITY_DN25343_c0_g1~~TRINITY_DN25343_c0_g1_i1.p1  ORF type:complete len:386 (+),score=86.60 TRINITY_DN25343_c0_g1_i1:75-1232(+)